MRENLPNAYRAYAQEIEGRMDESISRNDGARSNEPSQESTGESGSEPGTGSRQSNVEAHSFRASPYLKKPLE
jgi:hypothetical protein